MYSEKQTLFRLAMSSQLGATLEGTKAELELATAITINAELIRAANSMGSWKTVWGPAVFCARSPEVPDKVMFVAQGRQPDGNPWHVISISGTNPSSLFEEIFADAAIIPRQWPATFHEQPPPHVTNGALTGFKILCDLRPSEPQPGAGLSLTRFLAATSDSLSRLTLTAHSLGSAAACLLAFWLQERKPEWDPSRRVILDCYPFGGPASGDVSFCQNYSLSLGARSTRYYNRLDCIPRVWNANDLLTIPGLYNPPIEVRFLVPITFLLSVGTRVVGFQHVYPNARPLPGGGLKQTTVPLGKSGLEAFVDEFMYQHVGAYFDLLNIGGEAKNLRQTVEGNLPRTEKATATLLERMDEAQETI